jgi:tetratricopeptide (TPR) repeat protein
MLQRTVSKKGIAVLFLVILLAGSGALFLHRYQISRQISIYLQKANEAELAQNHKKAIELFERYLRLQPQDEEETTLRYIRLVDDSARSNAEQARAYFALEKMSRKYPAQAEIKRRLALRAMKLYRFRDAEEHLLQLIAPDAHVVSLENINRAQLEQMFSNCHDVELLTLLAKCEKNLSHPDSAKFIHEAIIKQFPDHTDSYREVAHWMWQNNQAGQADDLLRKMAGKNKSAQALLVQGSFLVDTGDPARLKEAEDALKEALKLAKSGDATDEILFANAKLASIRRNPQAALSYLQQGMTAFPKQAKFLLFAAELEIRQGEAGREPAKTHLRQALPLVSEDSFEEFMLAKLLLDVGEKEEATGLVKSLSAKFRQIPIIEYIRGRLLFEEGKLAESTAIFEKIKANPEITRFPDLTFETQMLLASAYRLLNNPERTLAACEDALKAIPTSLSGLRAKADALGTLGRYAEATDLLRKLPQEPAFRLSLLRWSIAQELQKSVADRHWNDVQKLLDQFSSGEKKTPEVMLLEWEVMAATEKTDALRQAIDAACAAQPKELRFWLAKLAFEEKQQKQDEATRLNTLKQTVSTAEKHVGDKAEFRLIRARNELRSQDEQTRRESLDRALQGLERFSSNEQTMLLLGLGEVCQELGMMNDAKNLFTKAIKASARNWGAYYHLLDIAVEQKNDQETLQLIKTLRELEGEDGVAWRLGTIERFFFTSRPGDRSAINETRGMINQLSKLRPGWYRAATLLGLLSDSEGDEVSALEQYRKAIELGERKPEVVKRTVQLLMKNRSVAEAQQVLSLATRQGESTLLYQRLGAELALAGPKTSPDTLKRARDSVQADSKDYHDHLWLGQLLLASGDVTGAEAPLRKAVSLGGQDPTTWANLVVYLVKNNRQGEAAEEMKRAELVLKNQSSFISFVSIPYFEALGQREQVEQEYKKLIAKNPKDPVILQNWGAFYFRNGELSKAEAVLTSLLQLADANPGLVRWARRNLALTLSVKGDATSFSQAKSLIDKNLDETGLSPADLNARALLMATRPGLRRTAIKDLEQAFTLQRPSPNESILLAQLYEDDGSWDRANQVWLDLVKDGAKPTYAAMYIRALLRNKKISEAAQQLSILEKSAPNDPITIETKLHVFLAQGKKREAVDLSEAQAARAWAERKDPTVFHTSAYVLEEAGEITGAETQYRRFLKEAGAKQPQAILAWIGFLGRQGRISEALDVCDQNWNKLPIGDIAMAAVSAFYYGVPKEEDFTKLEARLGDLRRNNPNDLRVALALADLYSLHGELGKGKAISLYRDLLRQRQYESNPIILNNLAWLLSEESDKIEQAVSMINRAIDQAGRDSSLLDTLGMIHVRQGKANEAIIEITEAISQAPKATRYMHLALAYHRAKKSVEAEQAWQKAVALGLDFGKLPQGERSCYAQLSDVFKKQQ